jgi:hypothetical protein
MYIEIAYFTACLCLLVQLYNIFITSIRYKIYAPDLVEVEGDLVAFQKKLEMVRESDREYIKGGKPMLSEESISAEYRYRFDDCEYIGKRVGFLDTLLIVRNYDEKLFEYLQDSSRSKSLVRIYVNRRNPAISVISGEYPILKMKKMLIWVVGSLALALVIDHWHQNLLPVLIFSFLVFIVVSIQDLFRFGLLKSRKIENETL